MTPSQQHCFDLVRQADKDRFLASLFAPDDKRPYLLALYAFNIEIARVRETVSEPQLGEIRHQWWRDAIAAIYGSEAPAHPIAQELARAIEAGGLARQALVNMIDARQFDLYDDPMPTIGDLEGYLGETASALIQLPALALAGRDAERAAESAGLAGVAYGITGLLRAVPVHRARGQCYVPKDILARHGASPSDLLEGLKPAAVGAALEELRTLAGRRLAEARALRAPIPRAALPAFLHAGLTELYLKALGRMGAAALTDVAEVGQWRRQLFLARMAWASRF